MWIAAGSDDGILRIFDSNSGALITRLKHDVGVFFSIPFVCHETYFECALDGTLVQTLDVSIAVVFLSPFTVR